MNVSAFIRKTASKDKATIYFRVRDTDCDIKASSELSINPSYWSSERQGYKTRVSLVRDEDRQELNIAVQDIIKLISKEYYKGANADWLKRTIFVYHHPNAYKLMGSDTVELRLSVQIDRYIKNKGFEKRQACSVHSIVGKVERFEKFQRTINNKKNYTMCIDTLTAKDLEMFYDYIVKEHTYYNLYPELYKGVGQWSGNIQRSDNTIHSIFTRLRTIIRWCIHQGYTTNNPFDTYDIPKSLYGTPFYLTIPERDQLMNADLSATPHLEMFRDMFIFQSLVGCRFGDLLRIKPDHVIDGVLEYIPHKTMKHDARTVRVPLADKAMAIFEKYKGRQTLTLFSHYNNPDYNKGIREAMKIAGINRLVSILDPVTRKDKMQPLYEVATSHTARKTFIGNLYRQVKDPNLIASMSGHVNGSQAFSRYRAIDDEMKLELINLLD
jgi:integrase